MLAFSIQEVDTLCRELLFLYELESQADHIDPWDHSRILLGGYLIKALEDYKWRKKILISGIGICLGVLFVFKYFNFMSLSVKNLFGILGINFSGFTINVILPVGISFYTFQAMSYMVDVYRKKIEPEKDFACYALYISYFPQLVAGPIERPEKLIPQLKADRSFDERQAADGIGLILMGFFKKIVVADTIARGVDQVYGNVYAYRGFVLVLATMLFAVQIYCDFSGYSDIARGSSKLLGIELIENFKEPYFSRSIKEFWNRWHISLSSWLRDYVYIPLGGNRTGMWKQIRNLLITFLLSGIWHGANWTFVIWGGLHGFYQVIGVMKDRLLRKHYKKGIAPVSTLVTFLLVCFAWIFFRAGTLSEAMYVIKNMFYGIEYPMQYCMDLVGSIIISPLGAGIIIFELLILLGIDMVLYRSGSVKKSVEVSANLKWAGYTVLLILIVVLCGKRTEADFIYFQF